MRIHPIYTITLLVLFLTGVLGSMPPHPEWLKDASPETVAEIRTIHLDAIERGLNEPGASVLDRMRQHRRDDGEEVTLHAAVILVDFEDNEADRDEYSIEHYEEMLFSLDEYESGSMRDFYLENSADMVNIVGDVAGWYRMPRNYSYYCNHRYGLGGYPRNAQKLAEDAVRAADDDLDFSRYDNDDDGRVEAVYIVHAGSGAEEDPDNEDLIWSHAWTFRNLGEVDGVRFHKYSSVPENGNIGVYAHELGHALFGLPDLYDTEYESAGIGFWSLMSFGAWGDDGRRPLHFDAWCKLQLEWVDVRELEYDTKFCLLPVETSQQVVLMWNPEERDDEYFLIENRQQIGFDGEILGEGLLVYHVDEDMRDNDNPWWPGHQGDRHNLVAIEQADGRWDLETYENDGDDGDTYPGSEDNCTFDAESEPGSLDYDENDTGVAILDIDPGRSGIYARWLVGVDPPEVEQTISLAADWNMISAHVIPESNDIISIFEPLTENDNLIILKNGMGRFYVPQYNFNNIPGWNPAEGYQLDVEQNDELTITGEPIDPQMPIQLIDGWQIVPYYPGYPLPVRVAFVNIGEYLLMVKDSEGRFYTTRFDYSNMVDLVPSQGYQVKVRDDVELVYPPEED
ncbi:MAG: M6 family metalloprotease domain-containing protein [Candidatus Hatepunaea meridiana]|nr:M6 family metalloprotease domain-containing protein [Candidatus Hatepunaea meridiana]